MRGSGSSSRTAWLMQAVLLLWCAVGLSWAKRTALCQLHQSGFHLELACKLRPLEEDWNGCSLHLAVPRGVFIDPFELIRELGHGNITISRPPEQLADEELSAALKTIDAPQPPNIPMNFEEIDVEAPEWLDTSTFWSIQLSDLTLNPLRLVRVPMHLRYHLPVYKKENVGRVKVLPNPVISCMGKDGRSQLASEDHQLDSPRVPVGNYVHLMYILISTTVTVMLCTTALLDL